MSNSVIVKAGQNGANTRAGNPRVTIRMFIFALLIGICVLTLYSTPRGTMNVYYQSVKDMYNHYYSSLLNVTNASRYELNITTTDNRVTMPSITNLDHVSKNLPSSLSDNVVKHLSSISPNSVDCAIKQSYLSKPEFHFVLTPNNSECDQLTRVAGSSGSAPVATKLLFTFVHSKYSNHDVRRVIRNTWGRLKIYRGYRIVTRFILGMPPGSQNGLLQQRIFVEQRKYDDIIQGNFVDAYANMSLKHASGLMYQKHYCPQAEWIVKADDDVFINFITVVKYIDSSPAEDVFCPWLGNAEPVARAGKWAISHRVYPYNKFPAYCHGQLVVYRQWLAREVHEATLAIPCHMWLDDVYFSGVLVEVVKGKHWSGLNSRWRRTPAHINAYIYQLLHGLPLPAFNTTMRKLWQQSQLHIMRESQAVVA